MLAVTPSSGPVPLTVAADASASSTLDVELSVAKAPSGTCFYADDASITRD